MPSITNIQKAASIILTGGVIAYPTESVYGLGCDPFCEVAVQRILQLKNRSVDKGLIIIASRLSQLEPYIEITEDQKHKILNTERATTWLVKKSRQTPNWVSGKHSKVAIRVSQHPIVSSLCETIKQPIISTSANPAGKEPAITRQQAEDYFTGKVDNFLENSVMMTGHPSTIIDIDTDDIIR